MVGGSAEERVGAVGHDLRVAVDAGVDRAVDRAAADLPSQDRTVLVDVADAATAGLRSDLVVGAVASLVAAVVLVLVGAAVAFARRDL